MQQEVEDRAVESAANHNFGHIVTTLQDSGSYPRQRKTDS